MRGSCHRIEYDVNCHAFTKCKGEWSCVSDRGSLPAMKGVSAYFIFMRKTSPSTTVRDSWRNKSGWILINGYTKYGYQSFSEFLITHIASIVFPYAGWEWLLPKLANKRWGAAKTFDSIRQNSNYVTMTWRMMNWHPVAFGINLIPFA